MHRLSIPTRLLLTFLLPLLAVAAINWRLVATLGSYYTSNVFTINANEEATPPDNSLTIPSIGLTAPITETNTDPIKTADWETIRSTLTSGINLSTAYGQPGDTGTVVAIGHSSDWSSHPYATIFANLNSTKPGDTATVTENGNVHRYIITSKQVVDPNDLERFQQLFQTFEDQSTERLVLVTCWPLLTTAKRLVVIATPAAAQ